MADRFVLRSDSADLSEFRRQMRAKLAQMGWPEKQIGEWALVLDETLTNVIRHAYRGQPGDIVIEITDSEEQTEFMIEDRGRPFDPTQLPSPQLPKETPGGLGIHFIRSLTDRFEYDRSFREGNRIRLARFKSHAKRSPS